MLKKFTISFSLFLCIISVFFTLDTEDANIQDFNSYIYPTITTQISSYFGYRTIYGKANLHNGIDFPVPEHSSVYATKDGIIIHTGFIRGYGHSITMLHENGYKSMYTHLSETYIVSQGLRIRQGELIGYVGPKYLSNGSLNGLTTGPHLHFSIFDSSGNAINPLDFEYKKRE